MAREVLRAHDIDFHMMKYKVRINDIEAELKNLPQVMSVDEVAERWRVTKLTVYRRIKSGDIPAFKVGGSVRIPTRDLLIYEKFGSKYPNKVVGVMRE